MMFVTMNSSDLNSICGLLNTCTDVSIASRAFFTSSVATDLRRRVLFFDMGATSTAGRLIGPDNIIAHAGSSKGAVEPIPRYGPSHHHRQIEPSHSSRVAIPEKDPTQPSIQLPPLCLNDGLCVRFDAPKYPVPSFSPPLYLSERTARAIPRYCSLWRACAPLGLVCSFAFAPGGFSRLGPSPR